MSEEKGTGKEREIQACKCLASWVIGIQKRARRISIYITKVASQEAGIIFESNEGFVGQDCKMTEVTTRECENIFILC